MDTDFKILKTWLLDNIKIQEEALNKAKSSAEYNMRNGMIIAYNETVVLINGAIEMRKNYE